MTPEEETNRIIAKFDETPLAINGERNGLLLSDLRYHNSWSWIMRVVDKIEGDDVDLGISVVIRDRVCQIIRHIDSPYETRIAWEVGDTKIEAVYKAILKFIEWYSQLSKSASK